MQDSLDPDKAVVVKSGEESYVCALPQPEEDAGDDGLDYVGARPRDLLQALYSARTCTYRIEMFPSAVLSAFLSALSLLGRYWTYELCHGRYILQYHEEKDAARRIKRQEYYLGQYLADQVGPPHLSGPREP